MRQDSCYDDPVSLDVNVHVRRWSWQRVVNPTSMILTLDRSVIPVTIIKMNLLSAFTDENLYNNKLRSSYIKNHCQIEKNRKSEVIRFLSFRNILDWWTIKKETINCVRLQICESYWKSYPRHNWQTNNNEMSILVCFFFYRDFWNEIRFKGSSSRSLWIHDSSILSVLSISFEEIFE